MAGFLLPHLYCDVDAGLENSVSYRVPVSKNQEYARFVG